MKNVIPYVPMVLSYRGDFSTSFSLSSDAVKDLFFLQRVTGGSVDTIIEDAIRNLKANKLMHTILGETVSYPKHTMGIGTRKCVLSGVTIDTIELMMRVSSLRRNRVVATAICHMAAMRRHADALGSCFKNTILEMYEQSIIELGPENEHTVKLQNALETW